MCGRVNFLQIDWYVCTNLMRLNRLLVIKGHFSSRQRER